MPETIEIVERGCGPADPANQRGVVNLVARASDRRTGP
jgi:hypothetical protein